MKRKYLAIPLSLLFACSASFGSAANSMTQTEVAKALSDTTITTIPLATLKGELVKDKVSVFFGDNKTLQGKFAQKPHDAPQEDKGNWSIESDGKLCVEWQHWGQKKSCMYLYDTKNAILFINTNGAFESLVLKDSMQSGNQVGK